MNTSGQSSLYPQPNIFATQPANISDQTQFPGPATPLIAYAARPQWPSTSHHANHEKNAPHETELPPEKKFARTTAPSLELLTAGTFLMNIPAVQRWLTRIHENSTKRIAPNIKPFIPLARKSAPEFSAFIKKLGNPRVSNLLLVSTVFFRVFFNTSIGVNQEQASMVLTNIGALVLNLPLMLMMELAARKGGAQSAMRYSKILSLVNLTLGGLFAAGFVQKSRHDTGKRHYNHDMRNFNELFDLKNKLKPADRLQLASHELKQLAVDSAKTYQQAWQELRESFSSPARIKTSINPFKPEGAPGRVAFSAFTMPLGALIALCNIKNNKKVAFMAAFISIFGNLANGVALALTAWLDKDQPFRWLGVLGGLASPIAEGVLTSKSPLGPAAMSSSNAFQNPYQATAWAHPTESQQDADNGSKKIYLNKEQLLPPPQ